MAIDILQAPILPQSDILSDETNLVAVTPDGTNRISSYDLVQAMPNFSSGGLPKKTYAELAAEVLATPPADGASFQVRDADTGTHTDPVVGGTVNNAGIYIYRATAPIGLERIGDTLSKTVGDDALAAQTAATDAQAAADAATLAKSYETKFTGTKNKFVPGDVVDGLYMNGSGNIRAAAGWGMSGAIPVVAGQSYTISGTRAQPGIAFYTTDEAVANVTNAIVGSYNGSALPVTVVAPAGATFMRINLYKSTDSAYSNIQVEDGATQTAYEPNGVYFTINPDAVVDPDPDNSITISGQTATLTGLLSDGASIEIDLTLSKTPTLDQANVFNFASVRRNGVTIVNNTDDAAPVHADGTTIGANHGYAKSTLTVAGHTKTSADVGSVWSDGTDQWVIVAVATDEIVITRRTANVYYPTGGGTLTHVSGATNTGNIVSTAAVNSQWYPAIKNRTLTMTIDGAPVAIAPIDEVFNDNVTFHESYDIMLKTDMVEWLIANSGAAHSSYDAAAAMAVTLSYKFDAELSCIISYNFTALKAVPVFSDIMVAQAMTMLGTNGAITYYVPKSQEFIQNAVTYDFSIPTAIAGVTLSSDIMFDAAKNDAGANPVDRLIQSNSIINFAIGLLPLADAAFAVRPTNASQRYFQIFASSKKVYPRLIDRADKTSLVAGESFSCIAYRKYFPKTTAHTAKYVVDDYLYLDWHSAKTDDIDVPQKFIGREFEVVEKSSNVTLPDGIASNRILPTIDASKDYGYAVLRFAARAGD